MITIYTHTWNPLTKEFWKWAARKVTRKFSGPDAVARSVVRGLKELKIPFAYNPIIHHGDTAIVLSGVHALKKTLALKKQGSIKKLVAGPNVVASPYDYGGIIQNERIDYILVPSAWVKDLWSSESPTVTDRLVVWSSGVQKAEPSKKNGKPIIYDKLKNEALIDSIREIVGVSVSIFSYGSFNQKEYLEALRTAPYVVYLSQSESQGLALQEAWAHNVPTFVNNSTAWQSGKRNWEAPHINAPYLNEELGGVFTDVDALKHLIQKAHVFNPKKYTDAHLSDMASTKKLLAILQ